MILYKYLSDLKPNRIIDIIKTENFYFAEWQKLNDPMEGYFSYYLNDFENNTIKQITSGKNWNRETYYIKAEITTEEKDVLKRLDKVIGDKEKT